MIKKTKKWDVRCPKKLKEMFPKEERRGYYYKVDNHTALKIVKILSKEYGIKPPKIAKIERNTGANAMYYYEAKTILLYSRNHMKSVFHEFYHHLDNMTNRKYNSDDRNGGETSLAWQFADLMWEKFTEK